MPKLLIHTTNHNIRKLEFIATSVRFLQLAKQHIEHKNLFQINHRDNQILVKSNDITNHCNSKNSSSETNQIGDQYIDIMNSFQNNDMENEICIQNINLNDTNELFKYTRMTKKQYNKLITLIEMHFFAYSEMSRLSFQSKIVLTLAYLSQGVSEDVIAQVFNIPTSRIMEIIINTSKLLFKVLSPLYFVYNRQRDWHKIAEEFEKKYLATNCIGSMASKKFEFKNRIKCFKNTKIKEEKYSVNVSAICDVNFNFLAISIYKYNFINSFQLLNTTNNLTIPKPLNTNAGPLYFMAPKCFQLEKYVMKKYDEDTNLNDMQLNFNKRLHKVEEIIDNAFGVLCMHWKILTSITYIKPENVQDLILACIVLHNFIISTDIENSVYCTISSVDFYHTYNNNEIMVPGPWRTEVIPLEESKQNNSMYCTSSAYKFRDILAEYFANSKNAI